MKKKNRIKSPDPLSRSGNGRCSARKMLCESRKTICYRLDSFCGSYYLLIRSRGTRKQGQGLKEGNDGLRVVPEESRMETRDGRK